MTSPLSDNYRFWTPEGGHAVKVGPDQSEVALPQIPLPVRLDLSDSGVPADDAVGSSIYDYLRQFPECPHNREYAEILRDAFPHYLADLGSQVVMLDHKDVDAPYVRRKIASMKILLLLDPDNRGLLLQLGISLHDLGLMFSELPDIRSHLTRAMRYLAAVGDDAAALNYLARIDYLTGDYPKAIARRERVRELVDDPATRDAISSQIASLEQEGWPEKPLVEGLEAIGEAMRLMAEKEIESARAILERLEEEETIPNQFPSPEFYYMLGLCRERTDDPAGAVESFGRALGVDPEHEPSRQGLDRVSGG